MCCCTARAPPLIEGVRYRTSSATGANQNKKKGNDAIPRLASVHEQPQCIPHTPHPTQCIPHTHHPIRQPPTRMPSPPEFEHFLPSPPPPSAQEAPQLALTAHGADKRWHTRDSGIRKALLAVICNIRKGFLLSICIDLNPIVQQLTSGASDCVLWACQSIDDIDHGRGNSRLSQPQPKAYWQGLLVNTATVHLEQDVTR